MSVADDAVAHIVGAMWIDFLRMPVELVRVERPPAPGPPGPDGTDGPTAVATVTITGAFVTVVEVACSGSLASQIAASVFGSVPGVSDADIVDAVKELANVVGGSVKAVSPGPAAMSVPTFAWETSRRCPCAVGPACRSWTWVTPSDDRLSVALLVRGDSSDDELGVNP